MTTKDVGLACDLEIRVRIVSITRQILALEYTGGSLVKFCAKKSKLEKRRDALRLRLDQITRAAKKAKTSGIRYYGQTKTGTWMDCFARNETHAHAKLSALCDEYDEELAFLINEREAVRRVVSDEALVAQQIAKNFQDFWQNLKNMGIYKTSSDEAQAVLVKALKDAGYPEVAAVIRRKAEITKQAPKIMERVPDEPGWLLLDGDHEMDTRSIKEKLKGQLRYRNTETGEIIVVPSVWYNQPYEWRARVMEEAAADNDECVSRCIGVPWLVQFHTERAAHLRALAQRMRNEKRPLA